MFDIACPPGSQAGLRTQVSYDGRLWTGEECLFCPGGGVPCTSSFALLAPTAACPLPQATTKLGRDMGLTGPRGEVVYYDLANASCQAAYTTAQNTATAIMQAAAPSSSPVDDAVAIAERALAAQRAIESSRSSSSAAAAAGAAAAGAAQAAARQAAIARAAASSRASSSASASSAAAQAAIMQAEAKKRTRSLLLIGGAAVLAGGVGFFLWRRR